METLKVSVPNMKCMGCSSTIENHLRKVGGVSNIVTDLETRTVTISYNGDNSIKSLVLNNLKGIGYPGEVIQ